MVANYTFMAIARYSWCYSERGWLTANSLASCRGIK